MPTSLPTSSQFIDPLNSQYAFKTALVKLLANLGEQEIDQAAIKAALNTLSASLGQSGTSTGAGMIGYGSSTVKAFLDALTAATSSGAIGKATQADLFAALAYPADSVGIVTSDPIASKCGFYRKIGASGTGSWVQATDWVSAMDITGPLATITSDVSVTVDLAAKTITGGGGIISHKRGYTVIPTNQNVAFNYVNAGYLMYLYADKTSGVLGLTDIGTGNPPANSVVLGYIYLQQLYANAPFENITLKNSSGATVYAIRPDPYQMPAIYTADQTLTINLQTGTVSTSATQGLAILNNAFVTIGANQSINFTVTAPTYLTWIYASKTTGVIGAIQAGGIPPNNSILLAKVYNKKLYADAPAGNIVLIDNTGAIQDGANPVFNDAAQRMILPDDMYFRSGVPLTLYKAPCFSAYQVSIMNQLKLWLNTNGASIADRFQYVGEALKIDPSSLGNTFEIGFRHESVPDIRYIKPIAKHVAAAGTVNARTFKMLVIGDSLTEVGMATAIKTNLEAQGATITPVGTYFSALTNNLRGEGRGFWSYRSFIGKDNYSAGVGSHTRSPGGKTDTTKFENPFLRLATATDYANNPDWCFRFTGVDKELSYTADPVKTGNFYIFDFAWYMAQHNVPAPDFITIALSTNDINLDTATYTQAERLQFMRLGMDIMVKQIKAALPNVAIGIIPAPAWSSTSVGDPRWQSETSIWIENCLTDVRALALTYSKLYVVPVWPFMSEDFAYPYSSTGALSSVNNTQKKSITDWVHFDTAGLAQYAEVVGAWGANVL